MIRVREVEMAMSREQRPRVAVVGSGVAGLTTAYLLQHRYAVTLYEADERLGGHAHTHDVALGRQVVAVDSGFIVHNRRTYPLLTRLFDELGVRTQPTEMSMSVRCDGCGLEYAGARGLSGVFAQPRNAVRPRFVRLLTEIRRFHSAARALLAESSSDSAGPTLGAFLQAHGFSTYVTNHFVIPLVATVWSSGTDDAHAYPARYLFAFLDNHGMLSVSGSPRWRTVVGGSRTYVDRIAKTVAAVRTATPVRTVRRDTRGVEIRTEADEVDAYDHAVIATHAGQALGLLAEPSEAERRILGAFRTTRNDGVLHTDTTALPRARGAAASWNYVADGCDAAGTGGARVTYDMTRLQHLPDDDGTRLLVSLGLGDRVDESRVLKGFRYEHPVYTPESVSAQRRVPELMTPGLQFAGAWQGWGFHEDGCASGVRAAARLGVRW
ncbi:NAD(P)/FAD-dependent oxidoreductase [Solicola gregarius]|uniref:FAD-dependent oxidoreductase n=1 Tax=Solicola gregarius TaxID=2908642 RepID=A0AA46TFX1_9ACTN|nr:FAD-dependent oxidoreductase [Solicola gregarius]UYM04614.1 FAD-dependent oxidoreductase [Solicola gregarius]